MCNQCALSRTFRPTMDYGREKGFQDEDSCRKTGGHSSGRFCLLATLLTASFGISLLALVLATSANLQVRGRGEGWADWIEEAEQAGDIPDIDTMELQNNPVEQVRISLAKLHCLSLLTIEPRVFKLYFYLFLRLSQESPFSSCAQMHTSFIIF